MAGLPCSGMFRIFQGFSKHVKTLPLMGHRWCVCVCGTVAFQVDLDGSNIITAPFQNRFFSWPWPIGVKYGSNGSLRVANFSCFCAFLDVLVIFLCVCVFVMQGSESYYNTAKRQSRAFFKEITIFSCGETFPGIRAFLQNTRELSWSQLKRVFVCFCVFSCVQVVVFVAFSWGEIEFMAVAFLSVTFCMFRIPFSNYC